MKPAGATTLLVSDDDAAVRAAVPAARDAAMDSILAPICDRLLIERVRGRRDPKRDR